MSTESRRLRLFKLQGGICAICFAPMNRPKEGKMRRQSTAEHVWPRQAYRGLAWNCVAAHRKCNEDKGHSRPNGCQLIGLAWVQALREASGERILKHEQRAPTAPLPKKEPLWLI